MLRKGNILSPVRGRGSGTVSSADASRLPSFAWGYSCQSPVAKPCADTAVSLVFSVGSNMDLERFPSGELGTNVLSTVGGCRSGEAIVD